MTKKSKTEKLKELNLKFKKEIENGDIHVATLETKNPHYHLISFLQHCQIAIYLEPSFNIDGGKNKRNSITSWLRRNDYKFMTRDSQDVGGYIY